MVCLCGNYSAIPNEIKYVSSNFWNSAHFLLTSVTGDKNKEEDGRVCLTFCQCCKSHVTYNFESQIFSQSGTRTLIIYLVAATDNINHCLLLFLLCGRYCPG